MEEIGSLCFILFNFLKISLFDRLYSLDLWKIYSMQQLLVLFFHSLLDNEILPIFLFVHFYLQDLVCKIICLVKPDILNTDDPLSLADMPRHLPRNHTDSLV